MKVLTINALFSVGMYITAMVYWITGHDQDAIVTLLAAIWFNQQAKD